MSILFNIRTIEIKIETIEKKIETIENKNKTIENKNRNNSVKPRTIQIIVKGETLDISALHPINNMINKVIVTCIICAGPCICVKLNAGYCFTSIPCRSKTFQGSLQVVF